MLNKKGILTYFWLATACLAFFAQNAGADEKKMTIGRMKVSIMPEYESPSVMVIQEGKFMDKSAFPAYVRFNLPHGVEKLTDVCSLSPGGQHFCQIYDIKEDAGQKFVSVGLPYSGFFVDFKYSPFEAKENSSREFRYRVKNVYDVKTLEVHVQKPFRSKEFKLAPASYEPYEKDEFEYLKYVFKDVKAGDVKEFTVSYYKEDALPSVDIKYTGMQSTEVFEDNKGELILGAGILALGIILFLRSRRAGKSES